MILIASIISHSTITMHTIRIGTSNIVLPGNKQSFPEEYRSASRLTYYASLFNTLEVNSSFYKVPQPETFARWAAEVPDNFRFTVKLWKGITHARALAWQEQDVIKFMQAARQLGNKKGCLLIQFPASVTVDYVAPVKQLLQLVRRHNPHNEWHTVVEFRHTGWYTPQTYQMLNQQHCSIVLHDKSRSATMQLNEHASVAFIRFHGTDDNYGGTYTTAHLQAVHQQMQQWLQAGKQVYAYFNNTLGTAYEDAMLLKNIATTSEQHRTGQLKQ
ncbi:uncharacterized protein YecE (DUF72 family) [Filimonas zeae]|uniref:DUF72 domain-containing protein n=1 Tax=Filimonas zeae TaxID=1737353 RepID=A0A917J036_9BACT|nr:DUF72 domain-containing protein [Filimonas zeae]MDR6339586.1 uncharacterized protein YecE (DUF72 family) [Filimonas zeae]GGH74343.1 hypothetical protein GCM10011379_36860 [Filimonas zeae]